MTLELVGVSVRYGSGKRAFTAVSHVDLKLPRGRTLGLVGESGCGKSTLAKAIVGMLPLASGRVQLDGDDYSSVRALASPAFRRRVQMVFQDPYASLNPRMRVVEALGEAQRFTSARLSSDARRQESTRLLELVGLPARALDRYPFEFSGGQRQRIAIARALAVKPDILICDEVTSALDVSIQATILNLLRSLQRELNLSYLFISHDLSTVRYMSDSVAVLYMGRIVEAARADELFVTPQHPYTRALLASIPRMTATREPAPMLGDVPDPRNLPPGCPFHTRCPVGPRIHAERTVCVERDPQDIMQTKRQRAACHFAPAQPEHATAAPTMADAG